MSGIEAVKAGGGGGLSPPVHVAIIMDGNGRWAKARGMPRVVGHRQGAEAVRRTVRGAAAELGIRYLTLYAFSAENWKRPFEEVRELMNLLRFYLRNEIDELNSNRVRLRVVGARDKLDRSILTEIERAEALTGGNAGLQLSIAIDYGGRQELVNAARGLAREAASGSLDPSSIDEAALTRRLFTAEIPDPDLLIRTGGDRRISNFLLWQSAYAELLFSDVQWPDFSKQHLELAVQDFQGRERRWGSVL